MVSVSIVSMLLALNQGPTIGRSPRPGNADRGGVRGQLEQPGDRQRLALAQLDDGPGAPLSDRGDCAAVDRRAWAKLSWLMTGSTSSRITSLGRISGRKVRIVPNRWNWTVTTAVPPGIDELCGTGNGNMPPTRNRAGCPSRATRFGSARIFARLLVRRASMNKREVPGVEHAEERGSARRRGRIRGADG